MAEESRIIFHKIYLSFDEDLKKQRIKDAKVLPFSEIMERPKHWKRTCDGPKNAINCFLNGRAIWSLSSTARV